MNKSRSPLELQRMLAQSGNGLGQSGTADAQQPAVNGKMHMTPVPTGKSVSLDELLEDDANQQQAPAQTPSQTQAPAQSASPNTGLTKLSEAVQTTILPGQRDLIDTAILSVDWALVTDWSPYLNREVMLPLALLVDSKFQEEKGQGSRYAPDLLAKLGDAMTEGHQEEAVQVRWIPGSPADDGQPAAKGYFEIIIGHRRTRSARLKNWAYIRAIVRNYDDEEARLALLISNRSRKDDHDYVLGKNYKALTNHPNPNLRKTQKQLAVLFSTNQSSVSKCINMLSLPPQIIEMLEENPGLFGCNTSDNIRALLDRYPPEDHDLVIRGVERLKQGAQENSIVPWVHQMVTARRAQSHAGAPATVADNLKERVVTASGGAKLVSMSTRGRTVRVRIEDPALDEKGLSEMIYNWLQQENQRLAALRTAEPGKVASKK